MKRLITLCFTVILFYPIWGNAQTTPQIIGTLTWNLSPPIIVTPINSCDSCFNYILNSMSATITHNGNDMHSVSWKGNFSYVGAPWSQPIDFSVPGIGNMIRVGSRYDGFMTSMVTAPFLAQGVSAINTTPIPFNMSCFFDSTTLSGTCVPLSGPYSQATLVTN